MVLIAEIPVALAWLDASNTATTILILSFALLSYTFDVYFGRAKPWHSFLDYALYVTFFPQLVAGPIVRSSELLPQFSEARRATAQEFGRGAGLLLLGLFGVWGVRSEAVYLLCLFVLLYMAGYLFIQLFLQLLARTAG